MNVLPTKDPVEVLTYTFDWIERLGGDTLAGAPTVIVTGATKDAESNTPNSVTVKLSGGTAGTVAKVEATGVTSAGLTIKDVAVLEIGGEAVSLATAKQAQRMDGSDEDVLLAGFLRAAVRHVETRTGKNLTQKVETQLVDGFPCASPHTNPAAQGNGAIRLWKGPVSEILSIKYDDANGVEQTLTSFRLVEGKNAKLLPAYGESWPATAIGPGTVRIVYVAGYDVADRDLHELTQAAILLFGHWNANREAVVVTGSAGQAAELPLGVEALIAPYCSPGIG
jgi:uncharacterized phiE125 gp8 family phage protein